MKISTLLIIVVTAVFLNSLLTILSPPAAPAATGPASELVVDYGDYVGPLSAEPPGDLTAALDQIVQDVVSGQAQPGPVAAGPDSILGETDAPPFQAGSVGATPPIVDESNMDDGPSAFDDTVPARVGSAAPGDANSHRPQLYAVRNSSGSAGTAVALGPNTLLSAAHVVTQATATVTLPSGDVTARVVHIPRTDVAILTVPGQSFPVLNTRPAQYFESVYIGGTRSGTWQTGQITGNGQVSLPPGATGALSGDSGGAVIGLDGALVGIIRSVAGAENNERNPLNRLVVHFDDVKLFQSYLPQGFASAGPAHREDTAFPEIRQPAAPRPATNSPPCVNGVCPAPSVYNYQIRRFRRFR